MNQTNVQKWRDKAEELRALRDHAKHQETYRILSDCADAWDRMADQAQSKAQVSKIEGDGS